MLLLGVGALLIGLSLDLCYAVGADALGRRVRSVRTTSRWRNRFVAAVYLSSRQPPYSLSELTLDYSAPAPTWSPGPTGTAAANAGT